MSVVRPCYKPINSHIDTKTFKPSHKQSTWLRYHCCPNPSPTKHCCPKKP